MWTAGSRRMMRMCPSKDDGPTGERSHIMRSGHSICIALSNVVSRQVLRAGYRKPSDYTRHVFHRRLICIVFVIIGLIGAPGIAAAGPIIVETVDTGGGGGAMPPELHNQYLAARLFDEVFVRQTPDVCALLMSANAINHTPAGDFAGPAGFEAYVAEVWTAYPNASFAIDEGVTDGDVVTLHWTIGGGQAGQLDGLAILRFEQDMIAESWIEYAEVASAEPVDPNVVPELCPPCREP